MHPTLLGRITEALDPADGTPLYLQLAAVVRWEIEHGRLPIGALLPPVRQVAAAAGVNYHTVRRAWGELEEEGVLNQRRGRGARVIRVPRRGVWSPAGAAVEGRDAAARGWVVAQSLEAAAALAQAIANRWELELAPWPLTATAPPPGPILCTAEVGPAALARWPEREGDLRPMAVVASPATLGVVRRNAALLGVSRVVIHGEHAGSAGRELLRQLPRLGLATTVGQPPRCSSDLATPGDALVLYFPDAWQRLDWSDRSHPRALMVQLEWAAGPLAGVAQEQGWAASPPPAGPPPAGPPPAGPPPVAGIK